MSACRSKPCATPLVLGRSLRTGRRARGVTRPWSSARGTRRLSLFKVVVVDLRDAQRLVADADTVVHHERGELLSIDEHDTAARLRGGQLRVLRERARRDEHALGCALQLERTHEALDLGAPDGVL